MQFVYPYSKLPSQPHLVSHIRSAAGKLYTKLFSLDIDSVNLSDYNKRYFGLKMKNLIRSLQLASYILSWSLAGFNKSYNNFHFIEYGAGTGLTSLLAKELGLTVTYNDIYDVSVNDAKIIAESIGNAADFYIQGDMKTVVNFLKSRKMECNAIASNDVIEHIYNIEDFFSEISLIPGDQLSVVMSSGANPCHPYINRKLMKKQVELENADRTKQYGHKERDTLRAYKTVRSELISEYLTESNIRIAEGDFVKLVENTRGMNRDDIFQTVGKYLSTKRLPSPLKHPTNTCDPFTGNWAEHLMNPYHLSDALMSKGFDTVVVEGYYGYLSNPFQRFVGIALDLIIYSNILSRWALRLAPFYTIYGHRSKNVDKPKAE